MIGGMFSETVFWVLLAQSTACLAAGLAGSWLLRRRAARAHQILLTSLLAAVLLPATYLQVRHSELGLLAPQAVTQPPSAGKPEPSPPRAGVPHGDDAAIEPSVEAEPEIAPTEVAEFVAFVPADEIASPNVPWAAIGLIGWAAAVALLLGRLLLRFVLGLRLLRRARPVETPALCDALQVAKDRFGMAGQVELLSSEKVRSPIIWCWRRVPVLLVHERRQSTKARDWAGVFCHELAHWKRLDHVSGLLAELLAAALPWHPLTWWAKSRLSRLSEEVCDDWVLAGGHIGVDYAESLLDLAPQSQPAFLPTVVGKERVMKTRIRRIVKDRCSNPTVGKRWAWGVSALVICIAAGVAFAQPGPVPRAPGEARPRMEPGQRPPRNQALALEGRRNVLKRMLDQLRDQARDTEAALREQGDQPSERRQILRAELAALRNQIQLTERQFQNLNQPVPRQPPQPAQLLVARTRRANNRLRDLEAEAEQTRRELEEIDDADSIEAQELRQSPETTQQQLRDAEIQLSRQRLQAAMAEEQAVIVKEVRARRSQATQEQARRRVAEARANAQRDRRMMLDQLPEKIRDMELHLRELEEQGKGEGDESRALRSDLRIMRDELRNIRQAAPGRAQASVSTSAARRTQATSASRRPAANRALETEVEELRAQVNGMNDQMRRMQELLEQLIAQREPGTVGSAGQR